MPLKEVSEQWSWEEKIIFVCHEGGFVMKT
jgi:hypothetical protein